MAGDNPQTTMPPTPREDIIDSKGRMSNQWKRWLDQVQRILSFAGGIAWQIVNKGGSKLSDIETRPHSQLENVEAWDSGNDASATKHISNAQGKVWQDHVLVIDGNPHGTDHIQLDGIDTDTSAAAIHHTLGTGANQAAAGNHGHTGKFTDPFPVSYYNDSLKFHGTVLDHGTGADWDATIVQTGPIQYNAGTYTMLYGGWNVADFPPDVSGGLISSVSGNTITIVSHSFANGDKVNQPWYDTGTLPTGLTKAVDYYVVNVSGDTFQLSTTLGGSAVTLSSTTTGARMLIENGRAFRIGRATSTDGITWTKQGIVIDWIAGVFKMTPDDIIKIGSTYYLFIHVQKIGIDDLDAYEERYYHTTDATLATWTYGGVLFSNATFGVATSMSNISILTEKIDGYYYATMDNNWYDGSMAENKFRTQMIRTAADPPISGWEYVGCVLDPEAPERTGTPAGQAIMGTRIWRDPISQKFLILSTCSDNSTGNVWSGLYLHYSDNVDGPYTTASRALYTGRAFQEGRHYILWGDADHQIMTLFTDGPYDGGEPTIGRFATYANWTNAYGKLPVADNLVAFDSLGNTVDSGIAKASVTGITLPLILNNTAQTIDSSLPNVSTLLGIFDQDDSVQVDLTVADSTSTSGLRGLIRGVRARGTLETPTACGSGDFVMSLVGGGYDGAAVKNTARIDFIVDGAVSSGVVPQRISFSVDTNNDGVANEVATLKSSGKFGVGTTDPDELFHVNGTAKVTTLKFADGTSMTTAVGGGLSYSYRSTGAADFTASFNTHYTMLNADAIDITIPDAVSEKRIVFNAALMSGTLSLTTSDPDIPSALPMGYVLDIICPGGLSGPTAWIVDYYGPARPIDLAVITQSVVFAIIDDISSSALTLQGAADTDEKLTIKDSSGAKKHIIASNGYTSIGKSTTASNVFEIEGSSFAGTTFQILRTDATASNGGSGVNLGCYDGAAMSSGDRLCYISARGSRNATGTMQNGAVISGFAAGNWSDTSTPGRWTFATTPSGAIVPTIKLSIEPAGEHVFSNSGGLPFGHMYSNTAMAITVTSANVWYEVDTGATDFTSGQLKAVTRTDHYLTVTYAGMYLVTWSMALTTTAAGDEIAGTVMVNGTATETAHGHATVSTANAAVTASGNTILSLAANDQISLAVENHSAARNISVGHANVSIVHIGS